LNKWTCPHYLANIKLLAIFAQQNVLFATGEIKKKTSVKHISPLYAILYAYCGDQKKTVRYAINADSVVKFASADNEFHNGIMRLVSIPGTNLQGSPIYILGVHMQLGLQLGSVK